MFCCLLEFDSENMKYLSFLLQAMMEFLTTEQQQEDLPMPSQDYEPSGYRLPAQALRGPPPSAPLPYRHAAQQSGGLGPNLQFFGPKDYVPEVPHLVARDFNGLELVAPRSEPRIDEEDSEQVKPVRPSEYLQLVPKPRYRALNSSDHRISTARMKMAGSQLVFSLIEPN